MFLSVFLLMGRSWTLLTHLSDVVQRRMGLHWKFIQVVAVHQNPSACIFFIVLGNFCAFSCIFVCFGRFLHVFAFFYMFFCSWGALGRSWNAPGRSWNALGALLGRSWVLLGALGALLGRSWGALGALLGHLWALLGRSWVIFGRSWKLPA